MKNKVVIIASVLFLVLGFFAGQHFGAPPAFAHDNDGQSDAQDKDNGNNGVEDQKEQGEQPSENR